jgi:type II secretory pathway component PulF
MIISDVIKSWKIFVIIAVIGIAVWLLKRFTATERGAHLRDKTMLAIPIFGPLIKQRIVARFASTLSTLLESGLSMADSLNVVAGVTGNTIMKKAVKEARERILSGSDIATPLRESGIINPTIAHMVMVGEKSGELDQMLKTISINLELTSDVVVERLSALIEPVIIIFMAGVVGLIAYAALVPMLDFSSGQF